MTELKSTDRADRKEKAVLVGVLLPDGDFNPDEPLDEIEGLAQTAGLTIVGGLLQKRQQPDIATYIGSGKVDELKGLGFVDGKLPADLDVPMPSDDPALTDSEDPLDPDALSFVATGDAEE